MVEAEGKRVSGEKTVQKSVENWAESREIGGVEYWGVSIKNLKLGKGL